MRLRTLLPALLAAAAGCSLDGPPQYRVPDLRILAIRAGVEANPVCADADLGEAVALEALVANPLARPGVQIHWYACAPWTGGPLSPCLDADWLSRPADLPSAPGVVTLGTGEAITADLAALQTSIEVALGGLVLAASAEPALQCALYVELPVVAVATSSDGVVEVAVKRARLSPTAALALLPDPTVNGYVLNFNPAVDGIEHSATDLDACTGGVAVPDPATAPLPAGRVSLCARATAESVQSYWQCQPDGSRVEQEEELAWQWYVSAGEIEGASFTGNATGDDVELTPPSGSFTLWVIVRDGRGGTAWATRQLTGP